MGNEAWLRLTEEARGGCGMHNAAELSFWDACNVCHVLEWHAATEGNACKHLEPAQPLQAG